MRCFNVPWVNILPGWQGVNTVALVLLCLAILCFPFSVAATNIFLGSALASGMLTGIWWLGIKRLWNDYRGLCIALFVYLILVCTGLLWSIDVDWGIRILARHWFWLLLPVVVIVLTDQRNRYAFLMAMSVGLTANLVFCVLQANGLVASPAVAGSTMVNATGHIGHTSFGFIYGIWAAWLLHLGLVISGKSRWLLWGLAIWSLVMVFLAQGKGGYIVSSLMILLVAGKWMQETRNRTMLIAVLILLAALISFGPGKARFQGVSEVLTGNVHQQMTADQENAVSSVAARLAWWKMSYEIWLKQPWIGVGTGGFPKAAAAWQAQQASPQPFAVALVHPHNQYLLSLVRWGVGGLFLLLALLYFWMKTGLSPPWRGRVSLPLIALTGSALFIDGFSTSSLEEHFSTIFALVLLGVGLSESACNSSASIPKRTLRESSDIV